VTWNAFARRAAGALAIVAATAVGLPPGTAVPAGAAVGPLAYTTSYYEVNASALRLYHQGEQAGKDEAEGIVILDFGRPAYNGVTYGMIDYHDGFVSLNAVALAVENYIDAYYRFAPARTALDVAVATNNSCGNGQPCGAVVCGCTDEPPDYGAWGRQLALWVITLREWAFETQAHYHYTDVVRVVAGDDAEPAFDPGFQNTYDLLAGYAATVEGTSPAMVDFGSAEASYWTEDELFQVAYGFRPDVAMPEIYYSADASEWAALLRYAKHRAGQVFPIYGVLAEDGTGTNTPAAAYTDMLEAAAGVNHQTAIPWLSSIAPEAVPASINP
jgi:hypothetical protein